MRIKDTTFLKACKKDNFDLSWCTQAELAEWLRSEHGMLMEIVKDDFIDEPITYAPYVEYETWVGLDYLEGEQYVKLGLGDNYSTYEEAMEIALVCALESIPNKCKDKIAFEKICELQVSLRAFLEEINCPYELHVPYFTAMFNKKSKALQRKRTKLAKAIGKEVLKEKITTHNKKRRANPKEKSK